MINFKYFYKSTPFFYFLWVLFFLGFYHSYLSYTPPPYEHQIDSRKREYFPAVVIDRKYYESCSKTSCSRTYYLVVERIDKSYKDVSVYKELYESTPIGNTVHFERHVTDPLVYNHDEGTYYGYLTLFFIALIIFGFYRHFEFNK